MFLFAFDLYTQINLFAKHILTNKFITTPYYIRWSAPRCLVSSWCLVVVAAIGGVLRGAWWCPGVLVVPGVIVVPGAWWLVSVEWSSVAGGVLGGGSMVILGGWCRWSGSRW